MILISVNKIVSDTGNKIYENFQEIIEAISIQAMYTIQTGGIKTYVDGGYEIGIWADMVR